MADVYGILSSIFDCNKCTDFFLLADVRAFIKICMLNLANLFLLQFVAYFILFRRKVENLFFVNYV